VVPEKVRLLDGDIIRQNLGRRSSPRLGGEEAERLGNTIKKACNSSMPKTKGHPPKRPTDRRIT